MTLQKGLQRGISLIFIGTMIYLAFCRQWEGQLLLAGGFLLCYLPWAVTKLFKINIPANGQLIFVAFVFCAQYLGSFIGFYGLFAWWDIALHFFSGFLMAYWGLIIAVILDKRMILQKERLTGIVVLIAFLSGVTSAGLWEIIEYLGDTFIGTHAQLGSLSDTMEDIICGTIGGGLFAAYIGTMMIKKKDNLIDHLFRSNGGGE